MTSKIDLDLFFNLAWKTCWFMACTASSAILRNRFYKLLRSTAIPFIASLFFPHLLENVWGCSSSCSPQAQKAAMQERATGTYCSWNHTACSCVFNELDGTIRWLQVFYNTMTYKERCQIPYCNNTDANCRIFIETKVHSDAISLCKPCWFLVQESGK